MAWSPNLFLESTRAGHGGQRHGHLGVLAEADKAKSTAPIVGGPGGFGGPESEPNTLRWLEGALGRLQGVVDGADAPPSADARASYLKLRAAVEKTVAEWKKVGK